MGIDHHSVFGSMVVLATTAKTKCSANVILKGLESPTFWTRMYPLLWGVRLLAITLLIIALPDLEQPMSTRGQTTKRD